MARLSATIEQRLIAAARRKFPPGNRYGVFGFDIGPAIHCGRRTKGRTLRVYVERKDGSKPAVPALRVTWKGNVTCVRPDVVATGAVPRAADGGDVPFTGLHVGAAITVRRRRGGICVILSRDGKPSHIVVAGHLFSAGELGMVVRCARKHGEPRIIGELVCNLLDERPAGLTHPIDAALVKLNEVGVAFAARTDAPKAPVIKSVLKGSESEARDVQAFGPMRHDYSQVTPMHLLAQSTVVSAARPSGYTLQDVFRTAHEITRPGDSGTILVTTDAERIAAGTCVGADGAGTLLEPLERTLAYFDTIEPSLKIWIKE
jgi:hypothetical protein